MRARVREIASERCVRQARFATCVRSDKHKHLHKQAPVDSAAAAAASQSSGDSKAGLSERASDATAANGQCAHRYAAHLRAHQLSPGYLAERALH